MEDKGNKAIIYVSAYTDGHILNAQPSVLRMNQEDRTMLGTLRPKHFTLRLFYFVSWTKIFAKTQM